MANSSSVRTPWSFSCANCCSPARAQRGVRRPGGLQLLFGLPFQALCQAGRRLRYQARYLRDDARLVASRVEPAGQSRTP
ncbi:hypothetical protein BG452_04730 [Streptomyces sp. CBMA123]|nr:hypothetical protein [Streptomyces sp. CBMA123]